MGVRLSEHRSILIHLDEIYTVGLSQDVNTILDSIQSKRFNVNSHCYLAIKSEKHIELKADYCIGLDWLGKSGRYLYVEPKINAVSTQYFNLSTENESEQPDSEIPNSKEFELDYLKMLLQVTEVAQSKLEINDLVKIDWNASLIEIAQKDDKLTPFLIVRFLQTLKIIVRKGLKKTYYKVHENLHNRIRGKLVIGQHIKTNVFKNYFTSAYCEYQVFGENHAENQFLKRVLQFISSYVENHKLVFGNNLKMVQHNINYCRPAFERISDLANECNLKHVKQNAFYKDYISAFQIGQHILKKFAYNITRTSSKKVASPPFWIDMPGLFELYIYSKMIECNDQDKDSIHFQFKVKGNALDILVSKQNFQLVIDAKYKLKYNNGHIHEDIRQVAGYARLRKVREKLNLTHEDDTNIRCLIIYPDMENGITDLSLDNILLNCKSIQAYYKIYKVGVKLPFIS